jgi:hypothetical protein
MVYRLLREGFFMSVIENYEDTMHKIAVKFVPAFLPEAKKPYYIKPVHQRTLNIREVAGKAEAYNIGIDPKVIEDGLNGGLRLIRYLAADGYRITTPLFNLRIRVPGEYDGTEAGLPEGVTPVVRLGSSAEFRKYVKDSVQIEIDGVDDQNGRIAEFLDVEGNKRNSIFYPGDQFILTGSKIKVAGGDPFCGAYLVPVDNPAAEVRITRIAENTRSKIIGICPQTGHQYNKIVIRTQYAGSSIHLKNIRTIESSFVIEEA